MRYSRWIDKYEKLCTYFEPKYFALLAIALDFAGEATLRCLACLCIEKNNRRREEGKRVLFSKKKKKLEKRGFDPRASRMQSERSTN